MKSFLSDRSRYDHSAASGHEVESAEGFTSLQSAGIPVATVEVPVTAAAEVAVPKVECVMEDERVKEIVVTMPDGNLLRLKCQY